MRRAAPFLLATLGVCLVGLQFVADGWPRTPSAQVGALCLLSAGVLFAGMARWPRVVAVLGPALMLVPLWLGPAPGTQPCCCSAVLGPSPA